MMPQLRQSRLEENRAARIAAAALAVSVILMIGSARFDSATFDEPNHIARGFEFLQGQCELAPHNPPLSLLVSALSAELMVHPYYPMDTVYLRDPHEDYSRGQGDLFLFASGNGADRILFWARIPVIALSLALGAAIFLFAQWKFDRATAVIATLLYAFSPTIIAHSRYATTDLAAAAAFFAGIATYIVFLERPSWIRTVSAGIVLGAALLVKYSTLLLLVLYPVLLLEWLILSAPAGGALHTGDRARLIVRSAVLAAAALAVVWGVSACLMVNYPLSEQLERARLLLANTNAPPWFARWVLEVSGTPFIRPLGEFMLGIAIAFGIFAHGQPLDVYFMGTTSTTVSHWYFPVLYLLKEPLPAHLLAAIAVLTGISGLWRNCGRARRFPAGWTRRHFPEIAMATFVAAYGLMALRSHLMIGVRHLLPMLPFIYLLVARRLAAWVRRDPARAAPARNGLTLPGRLRIEPRRILVGTLLVWLIGETIFIYPHFLSYYNELAGGPRKGHWYAAESNYDWGQDYRRFAQVVHRRGIKRIAVTAFEASSLRYYLGDAYIPWKLSWGPPHGWFAISVSQRDKRLARFAGRMGRRHARRLTWLRDATPVARIGYCFWLYKFP